MSLNPQLQNQILTAVDRIPQFEDFGVAYVGQRACHVLRNPQLPLGYQTWIVLKEEPETAVSTPAPQVADESSSVLSEIITH